MAGIEGTKWDGDLPPSQPGVAKGALCGGMISGGMMSYRCSLDQGHFDPESDDPEPHYTVEVHRTTTVWREWAAREWDRKRNPVFVASATGGGLVVEDTDVVSYRCPVFAECPVPIPHTHGTDDGGKPVDAAVEISPVFGTETSVGETQDQKFERLGNLGVSHPESEPLVVTQYDLSEVPPGVPVDVLMPRDPRIAQGVPRPTKQREGDQVLPSGDESQVDDQTLLIQDVEARRQVGIRRYGQAHRPFNGRDTLLDAYEEQLDFLVYLRSLRRMRDAAKDDLVAAVQEALLVWPSDPSDPTSENADWNREPVRYVADRVVERVMGWVVGNALMTPDEDNAGSDTVRVIMDVLDQGCATGATDRQIAEAIDSYYKARNSG